MIYKPLRCSVQVIRKQYRFYSVKISSTASVIIRVFAKAYVFCIFDSFILNIV